MADIHYMVRSMPYYLVSSAVKSWNTDGFKFRGDDDMNEKRVFADCRRVRWIESTLVNPRLVGHSKSPDHLNRTTAFHSSDEQDEMEHWAW